MKTGKGENMNKLFKHLTASLLGLAMAVGVGVSVANVGNKVAKVDAAGDKQKTQTFGYTELKSITTGYTDKTSYILVGISDTASVVNLTLDKEPTTAVTVALKIATFNSGTNPSASNFVISNTENWTDGARSGSLPTKSDYTIYNLSLTKTATYSSAITLSISKPGKNIRLQQITVTYSYTPDEDVVEINKYNGAYVLESGSDDVELSYSHSGKGAVDHAVWSSNDESIVVTDSSEGIVRVSGEPGESADITVTLFDESYDELCKTTQEFLIEPAIETKTVTEAAALCAGSSTGQTKAYYVSGRVTSIDNTKYGNINITDGNTVLYVYGCTSTSSSLAWDGAKYAFNNPQDYATNPMTSAIAIGNVVSFKAICYEFSSKKEISGVVKNVSDDVVNSIAVADMPTKTTYGVGEEFSANGLTIDVTYNSGYVAEDVSTGYTVDPATYTFTAADVIAGTKQFTVSFGGKSTTFNVSVVAARTIESIEIKEYPTIDSYRVGRTFDSTGLVITAHYDDESSSDYSSGYTTDCDGYVFTEDDLEAGTKTVTVTFEGKTDEFDVSIIEFLGFDSGRYFILNSTGTSALSGVASVLASPTQMSIGEAVAFDFEKVEDYTYEISVTVEEVKSYLVCNTTTESGSNTSIRVTDKPLSGLASKAWTFDAQSGEHEGTYFAKMNTTGSTYRYLTAYDAASDWRGYINTSNGDSYIKIVEEKEMFRSNFLNVFTASCDAQGATNLTTLAADWAKAEAQFESLSAANQALVAGTEDDVTERYDYIVGRYNAEHAEITNFMERSVTPLSLGGHFMNAETENTSIFVIVISVVSGISLAGVFFIRRRKEN